MSRYNQSNIFSVLSNEGNKETRQLSLIQGENKSQAFLIQESKNSKQMIQEGTSKLSLLQQQQHEIQQMIAAEQAKIQMMKETNEIRYCNTDRIEPCTRVNCGFQHIQFPCVNCRNNKRCHGSPAVCDKSLITPVLISKKAPCRNGKNCTYPGCIFEHPKEHKPSKEQKSSIKPSNITKPKIPCRNGDNCTFRPSCNFGHEIQCYNCRNNNECDTHSKQKAIQPPLCIPIQSTHLIPTTQPTQSSNKIQIQPTNLIPKSENTNSPSTQPTRSRETNQVEHQKQIKSSKYSLSFKDYQNLVHAFWKSIIHPSVCTNLKMLIKNTTKYHDFDIDQIELLKVSSPTSIEFLIHLWFHVLSFPKEDWTQFFKNSLAEHILLMGLTIHQVGLFFKDFETCWRGKDCKYKGGCVRTHGDAQCWDQFSGCGTCSCKCEPKVTSKVTSDDGFEIVDRKVKKNTEEKYSHKYGRDYFKDLEAVSYTCSDLVELPVFIPNINQSEIHTQQLLRYQAINNRYQQQQLDKQRKYETEISEIEAFIINPKIRSMTAEDYGQLVQGIHDWQKNKELENLLPCFQIPYKNVSERIRTDMLRNVLSVAISHGFTEEKWQTFLDKKIYDFSSMLGVRLIPYIMKETTYQRFIAHTTRQRGLLNFYDYGRIHEVLLPECRVNGSLIWSMCSDRFNRLFNEIEDDYSELDEAIYDEYKDDQSYFFGLRRRVDPEVLGNMCVAPLANTPLFTKYTSLYKSLITRLSFYDWLILEYSDAMELWEHNPLVNFDTYISYTKESYQTMGISLGQFIENKKMVEMYLSIHKFKLKQSRESMITWNQFRELCSEDQENLVQYFFQGLSLLDKSSHTFHDAINFAKEQCLEDGEYTKYRGNAPLCSPLLCSLSMLPNGVLNKFIKYTKDLTGPQILKLGTINVLVHPDSAPYFSILASALLTPEFFVDEKVRKPVLSRVRCFWNESKHGTQLKFDDTPLIRDINSQIKKSGTVSLFSNMLVPEINPRFLQALKKRHANFIGCPLQFIFGNDSFMIDDDTILYIYLFSEILNKTSYVETHLNKLEEVIGTSPLTSDIRTRFFTKSVKSDKPPKDNTKSKVTKKNIFYAGADDDSDSDNESDSESDSDDSDSDSETEFVDQVIVSTFKPDTNSKFFGANDDDDDVKVVKVVSSEKEEKEHTGIVNLCRIVNKKFTDDKGETTTRTGTLLVFKNPISEGKFKKINDELPSSCPRFHELLANDETNDQVFFMPYKGKDASVNTEIHYAIAKVLNRDVDSICVQGLEEETKVMVKKVEKAVVNIKPVPEKKLTGKAAWEAAQLAKAAAKEQAKNGANVNIKAEKAPRRAPPPSNKNKNTAKVSEEDEVDLSDMDLLDKLGY